VTLYSFLLSFPQSKYHSTLYFHPCIWYRHHMKLEYMSKKSHNAVYPNCCDQAGSMWVMLHLIMLPYVMVPLSMCSL
jgi:hypothetical protein